MRLIKILFWVFIIAIVLFGIIAALQSKTAAAATSIDTTDRWAWNDVFGWADFYADGTHGAEVNSIQIKGYATSSFIGEVSFDCFTSPAGNICGTVNYGICNGAGSTHNATTGSCDNPAGSGEFVGWAWNDVIGWISFNCSNNDSCGNVDYKVQILSTGEFNGYAWNDTVGWISFNCANPGLCGAPNYTNYKVKSSTGAPGRDTAYIESSVFNTQKTNGAQLNSIIWQGSQPADTSVDFQIATSSNSEGPWTYYGPSGSTTNYYGVQCPVVGTQLPAAGPNKAICVDRTIGSAQYLRYKMRLTSNFVKSASPQVDDVILNWSE